MKDSKSVVLLSGGIDSATVLAMALKETEDVIALTFSYGQRHNIELISAKSLAVKNNIREHVIIEIPDHIFGKSSLAGTCAEEVPKNRYLDGHGGIPTTYVPARNIIFLSYALALAESRDASAVYIGATAVDYSGYPDCRPGFFEAFNRMAAVGTKSGVEGRTIRIETPLLHLSKAEIIRLGCELNVDYSLTHSCYDPNAEGKACGECDSCLIRIKGFELAGVPDPTRYQ